MTTRRLAAILAADVVGFSAMMEKDEEVTLAQVKSLRREVIEPKVWLLRLLIKLLLSSMLAGNRDWSWRT
jgi:hypothetical protein